MKKKRDWSGVSRIIAMILCIVLVMTSMQEGVDVQAGEGTENEIVWPESDEFLETPSITYDNGFVKIVSGLNSKTASEAMSQYRTIYEAYLDEAAADYFAVLDHDDPDCEAARGRLDMPYNDAEELPVVSQEIYFDRQYFDFNDSCELNHDYAVIDQYNTDYSIARYRIEEEVIDYNGTETDCYKIVITYAQHALAEEDVSLLIAPQVLRMSSKWKEAEDKTPTVYIDGSVYRLKDIEPCDKDIIRINQRITNSSDDTVYTPFINYEITAIASDYDGCTGLMTGFEGKLHDDLAERKYDRMVIKDTIPAGLEITRVSASLNGQPLYDLYSIESEWTYRSLSDWG